tara:strand:+ start:252 stop:845 length:594 start_codon:yes stop_codon:yes gene_type:complete
MSEFFLSGWFLLALVGGVLVWGVVTFNRLVALRQRADEGWSGIDVQLKRRSNIIPNLIETVRGYMDHEKGILEKVTQMRARCVAAQGEAPAERVAAEREMSSALMQFFVTAENYPDLKASSNFINLQDELSELENHIQMARRYYNGTVRDLNTSVQSFPGNLVATKFGFTTRQYYEIDDPASRDLPDVNFSGSGQAK